jgi:hypothetical protein
MARNGTVRSVVVEIFEETPIEDLTLQNEVMTVLSEHGLETLSSEVTHRRFITVPDKK